MDKDRNLHSRFRLPVHAGREPGKIIDTLRDVIDKAAGSNSFAAVGIGTPGTYIGSEDRLYGSPHTPVYESPGFIGRLRDNLGVPVLVDNDANCLALAEFYASCFGKFKYVMAVVLGTGMGFGLILDEKLYRGPNGAAGELGHTSIDYNGRLCECGRKGCGEAYLSGPSLCRRFYEKCDKKMDVPEIFRLYLDGDCAAKELFNESITIMSNVFANAVNAFDLEAIILGGGVSNLPIWYENQLTRCVKKSLFGVPRDNIPILQAKLGDSAGVLGAAYLALRHLGFMYF